MKHLLLAALTLGVIVSCRTRITESNLHLIGGTAATASDIPFTVFLRVDGAQDGGCTGTKIAHRHFMTAAHCVVDGAARGVRRGVAGLANLAVQSARIVNLDNPASAHDMVTVTRVFAFPLYVDACQKVVGDDCSDRISCAPYPPDIAVIEVKEETPSIPVAPLDFGTLASGVKVVVAGYGCQKSLSAPFDANLQLKFGSSVLLAPSALDPAVSIGNFGDPAGVAGTDWLSSGLNDGGVSLCPGDSGGPLFRTDTTTLALVGINSNYSFLRSDTDLVAKINFHTRIDAQSQYHVDTWLKSVMDGSAPPTKISAQRVALDGTPAVVVPALTGASTSLGFSVAKRSRVSFSIEPTGSATLNLLSDAGEAIAADPSGWFKLNPGQYTVTMKGMNADVNSIFVTANVTRILSSTGLTLQSLRNDIKAGGAPVQISLASTSDAAVFRVEFPLTGHYEFVTQPEAQLTFLFFLPDQRGVAFATLDTDGHGIASAIFDSHGEFDVVVTTKDASQASLPVNLKLSLVAKGP